MTKAKFPTRPFYIVRWGMNSNSIDKDKTTPETIGALIPIKIEGWPLMGIRFTEFNPSSEQLWMAVPIDSTSLDVKIVNASFTSPMCVSIIPDSSGLFLTPSKTSSAFQIWSLNSNSDSDSTGLQAKLKFVPSYPIQQAWDNKDNMWDGLLVHSPIIESDNQLFFILEEEGKFSVSSVDYTYDKDETIDLISDDSFGNNIVVDNSESITPITGSRQIQYTSSSTTQFTTTNEDSMTRSVEASLNLGLVGKILNVGASGKITVTNSSTVTVSEQKAQTTEETYTYTFNIDVPAQKIYQYNIHKYTANYSKKYDMQVTVNPSFPGTNPYSFQLSGDYLGSNTAKIVFEVVDVTPKNLLEEDMTTNTPIFRVDLSKNTDGVIKISERLL